MRFILTKRYLIILTTHLKRKLIQNILYDEYGSKLFDQITKTDDYYPTRSELEILEKKSNFFKKILLIAPQLLSLEVVQIKR